MYVVTHDGTKPLAATPFAASPLAALDAAGLGLMILARDPAAALKTAARMLSTGVVVTPRAGAALFRDGYAAALRDLAAFVKAEDEASRGLPTLHLLGMAAQRQRIAEWITSHEPTEPLPYPDKEG